MGASALAQAARRCGQRLGPSVHIRVATSRMAHHELLTDERVLRWEGCLSIPGLRAAVPRAPRIRYRGVDCDGNVVAREVSGFHAGVVQHEYDHLNGILYPMRMKDFSLFGFNEELARAAAARQEGR